MGHFHFLALADNAALDIRAHVFVCGPVSHTVFISLGSVPEEFLDHVMTMFNVLRNSQTATVVTPYEAAYFSGGCI